MPSSIVIKPSESSEQVRKADKIFTGDVYFDLVHLDPKPPKPTIANVTFTPCARTYWHTHEEGQMLRVLQGSGWVCDRGAKPQRIVAGDVIWCEAGTTHWHGADSGSLMTHLVIGLGKTTWHEEVTDEEYNQKNDS